MASNTALLRIEPLPSISSATRTKNLSNRVLGGLLLLMSLLAVERAEAAPPAEQQHPPRTDRHGDPLPAGAVARIGTVRFRHSSAVFSVSYSSDGKILAAISGDAIRLWNAATGEELHRFDLHADVPRGFISPDGRRVWLQAKRRMPGSSESEISSWELKPVLARQLRKAPFAGKDLHLVTSSPDGKFLAIGDKSTIRIRNASTGEEVRRLDAPAFQASYSTDGKMLASLDLDALRLWNIQTGKEIRSFHLANRRSYFVNFALAPNGKTVAALCYGRGVGLSIRLWDTATGKERQNLQVSDSAIRALTFSPDGKILAVASQEVLRAWEVSSGRMLWDHRTFSGQFYCLAFAPDGKTLAAGLTREVRLYDAATGKERPPVKDGERIAFIKLLGDGQTVATAAPGKSLRFWHLPSGEEILPAPGQRRPAVSVINDVSPDAKWMASQDHEGRAIRIWDLPSGKVIHRLPYKQFAVCSFSPDGRWIQTHDYVQDSNPSNWGSELRFWDRRTGKMVSELRGKQASVPLFSPDSRLYATQGATRGICCLGSVPDGAVVRTIPVGNGPWRFAFSADGRLLAGASLRNEPPRLWEVASGKEITTFSGLAGQGPGRQDYSSYEIAFAPDNRKLVTGNGVGLLSCWDVEGRLVRQWQGDNFPIHHLHFTADGKTLVSGGTATVLIWNMEEVLPSKKKRITSLMDAALNTLWSDLQAEDATQAYRAIWRLAAAPDQAIPFLCKKLRPAREPDQSNAGRMMQLIGELDNDAFAVREKASRELATFGRAAEPALRKALASISSAESRSRIEKLLRKLPESLPAPPPAQLRSLRALAVLEYANTPAARRCLESLAGGIAESRLTREAQATLERVGRKSNPAP